MPPDQEMSPIFMPACLKAAIRCAALYLKVFFCRHQA